MLILTSCALSVRREISARATKAPAWWWRTAAQTPWSCWESLPSLTVFLPFASFLSSAFLELKKSGPIPGCNTTLQGEKLPVVLGKVSSILKWIEEKTSDAASTTTCRKQSPTKPTSYQCQVCGQPEATVKKVIGGRDAEPGEYPWAALVLIDNKYREGLSLDTELYLRSWLTSAGETRSKCPSSMY